MPIDDYCVPRPLLPSLAPSPAQSEGRRRQSLDHALRDAEAKLAKLVRDRDEANSAAAAAAAAAVAAAAGDVRQDGNKEPVGGAALVAELRGQVARARERAEILEERLDETNRVNRRLEREVAEAVELGVSGGGTRL